MSEVTGYVKDEQGQWHVRTPGAPCWRPLSTAHQVTEHDDGTITVAGSILWTQIPEGPIYIWHGYLERGVFRSVP